jgi:2-keto-3-deoxy-6-phosphogluconate aldolase
VAVGAGSELCPPQLAKDGKFEEISKLAAAFVQVVNTSRQ